MVYSVLSFGFAAILLAIVQGLYVPAAATPEQAMWNVAMIGCIALLYVAVHGFYAMRHSWGHATRVVYMALVFSFLPLLVAVYSIAIYQYSPSKLTTYQIIAMVFGGLAGLIDVFLFSWLTFRQIRLQPAGR